jgi:hypothetical protein
MSQDESIPLIVDLDGTLHASDLSWKIFASAARRRPYVVPYALLLWLVRGKAAMKCWLVPYAKIDVAALHWHQDVIDHVRHERSVGRLVVMATGTPESLAQQCNQYLDSLFDEVMGTSVTTNLIGGNKAQALVGRFGDGRFDYIGNSAQDLAVWPHCRGIVLAYTSTAVRREAQGLAPPILGRFPAQ